MSDLKYWISFNLIPGIGRVKFRRLQDYFGDMEAAWKASAAELSLAGIDTRTISSILSRRRKISPDVEMERLERHRVKALTCNDAKYPRRLKEIYDLPPILYVRGSLTDADEWAIAVVGTRRPTAYGREVTEQLVTNLSKNNITIVSGLAKGIDSTAHQAAISAGGRTIAVFACGLDMVYPSDHVHIAKSILDNGALVSEYPLGTKPKAENFPRRNRIMSGLCLGVLVVEAGERSGALITAGLAIEQNREVFAVPGTIYSSYSKGTNRLIQEGAKLVTGINDISEELNLTIAGQQLEMRELIPTSKTEDQILQYLSLDPIHIDQVCNLSKLPVSTVTSTLTMLELKGLVKQAGGMNYSLVREHGISYQIRVE